MDLSGYDYHLPRHLIALRPASPRDRCRLLVYQVERDSIEIIEFIHISQFLPPSSLVVFNDTRVIPTRITLTRQTGGKVVCLLLLNEPSDTPDSLRVMVDRKISPGDTLSLTLPGKDPKRFLLVSSQVRESIFEVKLMISKGSLVGILKSFGSMPIPPYLRDTSLTEEHLRVKYQTIFAQDQRVIEKNTQEIWGSIAAPTAGLHFSSRVLRSLENRDIHKAHIELGVGLGTFAPLTSDMIESGHLHDEWYRIPNKTLRLLDNAKTKDKRVVAVGTTVVRSLESFDLLTLHEKQQAEQYHRTDIFIRGGFDFRVVDSLVTNFHLPNSSLLMLVDAFLQYRRAKRSVLDLYNIAISNNMQFYSFGDAMLVV